ncbi:hypothetical protein [Pseudomonas kilonensis]|uniref:hypothetical protein n=1 Tax=Pseudomonas kilonensis TaxID=132476 RepID=UPI0020A15B71|nr:hypothetical protein [Pseudomonas kilonensis]MCP1456105.1 hypothetical protein [Pseudomonas kilonensis]
MTTQDKTIRRLAMQRIASAFRVSVDELTESSVLGRDLNATRAPGFFNPNECDIIEGDILDVCTKEARKAISSGNLTIYTVGDYCNHMIECYKKKPKDVIQTLKANSSDFDQGS